MKKKIIASILLSSVMLSSCAANVEETTEEITATTQETTETTEESTTATTARPTPRPTPGPASTTTAATTTETTEAEEEGPYRLRFIPVMPDLPESMASDANLSEEENLIAFYNERIVPLYGQTPAEAESPVFEDYPMLDQQFFDLDGAVTYSVNDFDNDGDIEMVAVVLVSEPDNNGLADTEKYRVHLMLCDDVDGQVSVIKDMPLVSHNNDERESVFLNLDEQQVCFPDRSYCYESMRIYTINRDGKVYILMTYEESSSFYSNGYSAGAVMIEVTAEDILLCSAYMEEPGSDDTSADEISYENGVEVSRTTYYMYPEYYGESEDMVIGLEYYIDRLGLARSEFGAFGTGCRIVNDSSADTIAELNIFPVIEDMEQYPYYPVYFRFEAAT